MKNVLKLCAEKQGRIDINKIMKNKSCDILAIIYKNINVFNLRSYISPIYILLNLAFTSLFDVFGLGCWSRSEVYITFLKEDRCSDAHAQFAELLATP